LAIRRKAKSFPGDNSVWRYRLTRSMLRKLDKVEELPLKDLCDVGFIHIRPDRNSHGDNAPPDRTRSHANVSAAALAAGHLSDIVYSAGGRMSEEFQVESLVILRDAIVRIIYALNRVGKGGCPLRNITGVCENIINSTRLRI
jgi:hypothetical protein